VPFEIVRPPVLPARPRERSSVETCAVVIEVPHAGLTLDEPTRRRLPKAVLEGDAMLSDSDIGADAIYRTAVEVGATCILARTSRYVIDLNTAPRAPSAYEDKLPPQLREIRRISANGQRWYEDRPSAEEHERLVRTYLEPYHEAVSQELDRAATVHGAALLLSAHTYPSAGGASDAVIGTLHGATATEDLRQSAARRLASHGLSVSLEVPFPGGYALVRHARASERRYGLQLELGRHLLTSRPGELAVSSAAVERLATVVRDVVSSLHDALRESPRATPG
jgi:N-formylglutamate deformylase